MEALDLYRFIEEYLEYKVWMISYNPETNVVKGILYDSFFVMWHIDKSLNEFRAELRYGDSDHVITEFLGKKCVGKLEHKSIQKGLDIIDNYCRLRLPDKFLDAHYKAYVLSQYEDCDM